MKETQARAVQAARAFLFIGINKVITLRHICYYHKKEDKFVAVR